jgi:hypothetical protein
VATGIGMSSLQTWLKVGSVEIRGILLGNGRGWHEFLLIFDYFLSLLLLALKITDNTEI